MDAPQLPDSPVVSASYSPLADREAPDSVLPEMAQATSFLARRFAQSGIYYEDLRQEGLLACVLAASSFGPLGGASFPTYALHCAQNRMLDFVRREKRASKNLDSGDAVVDEQSNETLFDHVPDHPAFLENPEHIALVNQMNAAIARLPERERHCLQFSFFEDLTHEEISLRLGVTRARVGQLIGQAIGRLRKVLVQ